MNKTVNIVSLAALGLGMSTVALAQDEAETPPPPPPPPPNQCEELEAFTHFDFWVGEWNVYGNTEDRPFAGTNSITKIASNCLLLEQWTAVTGDKGYSMNFYDPVDDQWRQVWVSQNVSIDYTGGLNEEGQMVLEGTVHLYQGASYPIRGTWTPNEDGTVRQFFEQGNAEGVWQPVFDGIYIKDETS